MPYSAKKCPAQTSSPPSRIAHVRISGHADRATEQRTGQALDGGVAEEEHRQVDRVAARLRNQRSEEHTSELQSLMRISYAVFCLKKKTKPRYITLRT